MTIQTHSDVASGADGEVGNFTNSYIDDVPELSISFEGAVVPEPGLVVLNEQLATELGLSTDRLATPQGLEVLAGSAAPPGSKPVALVYAGHQFGGYSPRLGDGRALLVGELLDDQEARVDLHLKGSGRTPLSRGGDGKASLGPMLREYLFAEGMHALGIPSTRALAVVTTGEPVQRETPEPGAVLARVAASHLRVGTFEYAVRLEDDTVLRRLADHAIERHYPHVRDHDDPYLGFFEAVVDAQASLVAKWMLVGFVHGVLNTDNVTISGESIDYGPCAFMDRFDQATVFSSIDHGGRYAYGNQPSITGWNLTRLAETLIPLLAGDADESIAAATAVLESYTSRFHDYWKAGMRAKLGLPSAVDNEDALFDDFLGLLHNQQVDYTSSFRALARSLRDDDSYLGDLFTDQDTLSEWMARWRQALPPQADPEAIADSMDAVNPIYILRNHLVDAALVAAHAGQLEPFEELLAVVTDPFTERPGLEAFAQPAPAEFNAGFKTFCGT